MNIYSEGKYINSVSQAPVTICIPVYNGAIHLMECLNSVVNQSFSDFQVLVVDNASTDGTAKICLDFDDERFHYLRNDCNIGSIKNHNRCIDLALSEYFKILSSDDVLFNDTIERQFLALRARPELALVTVDCTVTGPNLEPLYDSEYLPGLIKGEEAVRRCVFRIDNKIGGPSNTMLRRNIVGEIRYDTKYKWLADLDFHCRLLGRGDYFNVGRSGFFYRRHAASDSALGCPLKIREQDEIAFVRQYGNSVLSYVRLGGRWLRRRWSPGYGWN